MKKVIFFGLMCLAVGFSQPATGNESKPAVPLVDGNQQEAQATVNDKATGNNVAAAPVNQGPQTGTSGQSQQADASAQGKNATSTPGQTTLPGAGTTTVTTAPAATTNQSNTTANNTNPLPTEKTTPVTEATTSSKVTDKPTEKTTEHPKTNTTVAPTVTSTEKPVTIEQGRSFDGASFIGGIILTLGLLAMGFIGFKYYKARIDRNYHTL